MASLPSSSIVDFEFFRSKRVCTSFSACWMAFETSCRSTLLTMSNDSAMLPQQCNRLQCRAPRWGRNRHSALDRWREIEKPGKVLPGAKTHFLGRNTAQLADLA